MNRRQIQIKSIVHMRFEPVHFLERVREFFPAADCVFHVIGFNGPVPKMQVLFLFVSDVFCRGGGFG